MAVLGATQYLQASIDRWHRERDKRLIYRRKSFCFSIRYVSAYRWCGWCSRTGNRNVFDDCVFSFQGSSSRFSLAVS